MPTQTYKQTMYIFPPKKHKKNKKTTMPEDNPERGSLTPAKNNSKVITSIHPVTYAKIDLTKKRLLLELVLTDGKTIKDAASTLKINQSSARTIISKIKRDGGVGTHKRGGNNTKKLTENILVEVERAVENNTQVTLKEIRDILVNRDVILSIATIYRGLEILKVTFKRASKEIDKVNSPITIQKRKIYAIDFSNNAPENKSRCIFIDECGYNLHLRRGGAWSKKGTRANIILPAIRGRNITVIAAMNRDRIIHYKIISDGNCNSEIFGNFLSELIVILNSDLTYENSWLILDNAQIHRTSAIRDIILNTSYVLKFLSPYSYMLNPIENVFSKMKATARRILTNNVQDATLSDIIVTSIESIQEADCINYVIHMLNNISLAIAETVFRI